MNNREWLYSLDVADLSDWFDAEHVESPTSATMQHIGQVIENTVKRGVYGDTEPQDADSRERLEADAKRYIKYAADYAYEDVLWAGETFTLHDAVIELLDRQAAITLAKDEAYCQECNGDYYKLQDERDELKGQVFTLKCECDDLENERDKLQEQLHIGWECECRLQAERERYRSKFGKCLDYADAIHALMDDEGLA